ncbi:MAG: efflux RND transporter permease subunit [Hyphomicrobiales bacterium]|nr:efflux RND transporter permease subunit [Hyphomicrobiales bacterium]
MDRFNLSSWAIRHPQLTAFLIIVIGIAGAVSYSRLGRAEDPDFSSKVSIVTVEWPGATTGEMQSQVADRVEKKLQELPWIDKIETYSKPGFAAISLSFRDSTPPRDLPMLFLQLRKKMVDVRPDLPDGVVGPLINDDFGDVDSVLFTITGDGASFAQLKDIAEAFRKRLQRVPDVVKVDLYGDQPERVFVEFSHAKLATLGAPLQSVFDSIAKQNALAPAGEFQTDAQRMPVRVTGAQQAADAVAETPVFAGGQTFRLGDVANVYHGYQDPPAFLIRAQGQPALEVGVVKQKGGNILALGKALDATLAEFESELPRGVTIARIADQPAVVDKAVFEFTRSFIEALAIVLAVSFLSLGWRAGFVVATSVPLVLAIVFVVMALMGLDLHRITLGALIIALGLLVDDAIIATEMIVVKLEQGWDRERAASFAWTSTAFPMLTGTLVAAAGFMPIGLANSGVGEYTGGIFWVVGIALIVSWFVAVFFTPYLGFKLLPDYAKRGRRRDENAIYATPFYRAFRKALEFCVARPIVVIALAAALLGLALSQFSKVQQQFFPLSERTELFFELRLAEGSSMQATKAAVEEAEKLLAGDKDATSYTAYIGQSSPRFWLGLLPVQPNESFAQIVVVARDVEARERIKARIEAAVAKGALSQARVRLDRFNFGPPVGFPVQFRVIGPNPDVAHGIAGQVRDVMLADRRLIDPHLDWGEKMPSLRLEVDQARARALGLTPQDIAQTLQTLVGGATVTTLRVGEERVDVVARAIPSERAQLDRIEDMTVASRDGAPVPVGQVARVVRTTEEPIIRRRNREIAVTAVADVINGVQPPDVSLSLWPKLAAIRDAMPPGYRIEMGGAIEESQKANASIAVLFPVMILIMLTVLMVQMQSFSRLAMVFFTAPLGIVGASLALNLAGKPFGFVALLGLIALAGMDMRNTVILVDQIETDVREHGLSRREAIVFSTMRRARPVALTALAAILAMIPLSESAFWGPMAFTIMGGLSVATFLTLFLLPAVYALWHRRSLGPKSEGASERSPSFALPIASAAPAE